MKASNPNLQPNPFVSYRDPQTGLWKVLKSSSATLNNSSNQDLIEVLECMKKTN